MPVVPLAQLLRRPHNDSLQFASYRAQHIHPICARASTGARPSCKGHGTHVHHAVATRATHRVSAAGHSTHQRLIIYTRDMTDESRDMYYPKCILEYRSNCRSRVLLPPVTCRRLAWRTGALLTRTRAPRRPRAPPRPQFTTRCPAPLMRRFGPRSGGARAPARVCVCVCLAMSARRARHFAARALTVLASCCDLLQT